MVFRLSQPRFGAVGEACVTFDVGCDFRKVVEVVASTPTWFFDEDLQGKRALLAGLLSVHGLQDKDKWSQYVFVSFQHNGNDLLHIYNKQIRGSERHAIIYDILE